MIPYYPIHYYNIFGFKVVTESIAMILGFGVFLIYTFFRIKKEDFDKTVLKPDEFNKFMIILILFALVFGRIWHFLFSQELQGWMSIIKLFDPNNHDGGLVSIGMIVGGVIGVVVYLLFFMKRDEKKFNSIEFAKFVDILAPATALWIFIYRLFGCSIYGDVVGTQTNVPWALVWPDGVMRHPTSFYLALSALVIFFLLRVFFWHEKTEKSRFGKRFDGEVALWFLLLYCFNRFFIEFFRVHERVYAGLDMIRWVCLVGFLLLFLHIVAFYLMYLIKKDVYGYPPLIVINDFLKR